MYTGREVVDTIKEAFELFSEMELPLKEREVTIMYEAALPLIGYIEHLEAAQPKWISVEDEQKPRHGEEYLCVCALPNDPKHEWDWIMVLRWYSHGSNGLVDRPHFTDEGVNGMYVTHWMPKPKLPKEEAND